MDKLLSREAVMIVIFCVIFTALVAQIVQCIIIGFGGITEEAAEDENSD